MYTVLGIKKNSAITVDEILLNKILGILNGRVKYIGIKRIYDKIYDIEFGESQPKERMNEKSWGFYYGYHPLEIATFLRLNYTEFLPVLLDRIKEIVYKSRDFDEFLENLGDYKHVFVWGTSHVPCPFLKEEYVNFCRERSEKIREISEGFWKYLIYLFLRNVVRDSKCIIVNGKTTYQRKKEVLDKIEEILKTFEIRTVLPEFLKIIKYLEELPRRYKTSIVYKKEGDTSTRRKEGILRIFKYFFESILERIIYKR